MPGEIAMFFKALIFSVFSWSASAAGPDSKHEFTESNAFDYLEKFGYIDNETQSNSEYSAGSTSRKEIFQGFVKKFQKDAGLDETGELDSNTVDIMLAPRCGVPFAEEQVGGEKPSWKKKALTYRIIKFSRRLSKAEVKRTIRQALDFWEAAADLTFTETTEKSDLEIMFGTELHGDGLPFDGSGGVLAHAYYPSKNEIAGDAHFDDDEPWSVTSYSGKQLLQTATHELGHSLGLSHSRVRGSVMYFSYPGWDPKLKLHQEDINRVQELYGPARRKTVQTKEVVNIRRDQTTPAPPSPCVCEQYTIWDTRAQKSIGNCKTMYRDKKWCYILSEANCQDKKKSSKVNRYWSWDACNAPVAVPKTMGHCQCNGVTRYDARNDKTVGHCQTEFRGNAWCYTASDSACEDKKGTRRNEDGKRYWSALACRLETPFQRDTEQLEQDYAFVFPDEFVKKEGDP